MKKAPKLLKFLLIFALAITFFGLTQTTFADQQCLSVIAPTNSCVVWPDPLCPIDMWRTGQCTINGPIPNSPCSAGYALSYQTCRDSDCPAGQTATCVIDAVMCRDFEVDGTGLGRLIECPTYAGCGCTQTSGGGGGGPQPGIEISVNPLTATINQGGVQVYAVTVDSINGFTGDVSLSNLGGCPATAQCRFTQNSVNIPIENGFASTNFTVSNTNSAPAGTYTFTLLGETGSMTDQIDATLILNAAPIVSGPPSVYIDNPISGSTVSGTVNIQGWAIDNTTRAESAITSVRVLIDGVQVGTATAYNRQDVCNAYPGRAGCPNVGYQFSWNSASVTNGTHTVRFLATDSSSPVQTSYAERTFTVNNPVAGTSVVQGYKVNNDATLSVFTGSATITATGPETRSSSANPFFLTTLPAGTYTVNSTVPSGYTVQYSYIGPGPATYYQNQSFTTPGWVSGSSMFVNVGSGQTIDVRFRYTPAVANTPPSVPTIQQTTGTPGSGTVNTSYNFRFYSTDPQNDQIRYGIDWNLDNVADEWLPAGVNYVNSGTPQTTSHSWSTTGIQGFRALAQDAPGLNSAWSNTFNMNITAPACTQVPGGWTSWSACDPVTSTQTRTCTDPSPSCGGANCVGSATQACSPSVNYELLVTKGGQGTVTSTDGGISCGSDCSQTYTVSGTSVTLNAVPGSNRVFTGWQGVTCGEGNQRSLTCTFVMNGNKSVNANFAIDPTFREF